MFPVVVRHLFRPGDFEPLFAAIGDFLQFKDLDVEALRDDVRATDTVDFADFVGLLYRRLAAQHGKSVWGDKAPGYTNFITPLASLFPEARFIHVVRDPRAVALSWTKADWGPNTVWHASRDWVERVGAAVRGLATIDPSRHLLLRFEDVVGNAEATLRKACALMDLEWEPAILDAKNRRQNELPSKHLEKLHSNIRKDLDPKRSESWRSLSPRAIRHIESVCTELMTQFGYEPETKAPSIAPWERFGYKVAHRLRFYRNRIRSRLKGLRPPKYRIPTP
jgi:hypothetical protein